MNNRFYNIVNSYLNEETVTINPANLEKAMGKIQDPQVQKVLNATATATADATDTDPIHKNLMDVIDPKNPKKFTDVFKSPAEQMNALKKLAEQGIPILNQQQNQQQNKQQTQTTPQTTSTQTTQQTTPTQTTPQNKTDQGKYPGVNA